MPYGRDPIYVVYLHFTLNGYAFGYAFAKSAGLYCILFWVDIYTNAP